MVPVEYPAWLWVGFFHEVGSEVMAAAYHWEQPQLRARPTEKVFAFYALDRTWDRLVGWSSLVAHPTDTDWLLAFGVRPKYQNRGWRKVIADLTTRWAFADRAESVTQEIFETNETQLERMLRENEAGSGWAYSGHIWSPTSKHLFTRERSDWNADESEAERLALGAEAEREARHGEGGGDSEAIRGGRDADGPGAGVRSGAVHDPAGALRFDVLHDTVTLSDEWEAPGRWRAAFMLKSDGSTIDLGVEAQTQSAAVTLAWQALRERNGPTAHQGVYALYSITRIA